MLHAGNPLVEATVIHRQGSTPRSAGAKMIIGSDGRMVGSLGGGMLEAEVIRTAQVVFQSAKPQILLFDLTDTDAATQGMICGGRNDVLLDFIPAGTSGEHLFQDRLDALKKKRPAHYVTLLYGDAHTLDGSDHHLIPAGGPMPRLSGLPPAIANQIAAIGHRSPTLYCIADHNPWAVVEVLQKPRVVYLFGAGHVAVPTAHFAAQVGFEVVVLDDRQAFANPQRFPLALETHVLEDFSRPFDAIVVDEDAFLVIATRGHVHDRTVLSLALSTSAAYIGMMGSRSKRQAVYEALLTEGFSQEDLDRVHCPIGLSIAAETPEEIGISIVAELIRCRAAGR